MCAVQGVCLLKRYFTSRSLLSVLVVVMICAASLFFADTGRARRAQLDLVGESLSWQRSDAARQAKRELMQREIADKQHDPHYLILRSAVFDPLKSAPSPIQIGQAQLESTRSINADQLAAESSNQTEAQKTEYFIVQFNGPIQSKWTDRLRAQGCEISGYLANNAFIVKATRANIQSAQSVESNIRWIGNYGAGLKVESDLLELANEAANNTGLQNEPQQVYQISILTFKGESAAPIRDAVGSVNLVSEPIVEARADQRVWAVFAVGRSELSNVITTLASVPSIEWIEQRQPNRLQNDNVVRAVQSGFISNDTPLYRNGLTGAGQIYGTADSGLDGDHSQFRLDSNAASQTLSFPTTTASLVNGLLPVRITNQNNKVLAYYVLGSSGFVDSKDNPNGGQTLDPDRKSGTLYLNAVAYDDNSKQYHGTLTTSTAVGRNYAANASGAVPGIATRSTGDGVAPDARVVFQDVGHPSGQLPGVDFVSQAMIHTQAYSSGVRVHNNSYGPAVPVSYDQSAADIDDAMWRLRDYTIFFAAGNNSLGDYQVINVAKNDIVVGATDSPTGKGNLENLLPNSNHGPTFDGRTKPDIVAPGTVIGATEDTDDQISSSYNNNATSATAKDAAVNPHDPNNNSTLTEKAVSGTSFASAAVAGGALLARQYFTDGYYPGGAKNTSNAFTPSNALIKAVILNSGRNVTGRFTASNYPVSVSGALPNNGQGWGRIALDDALYFAGDRRELKVLADIYNGATASESNRPAPNAAITTGQTHTYQITNVSNVEPLRITLVWSDPRAAIGSAVALVNNLNLEITDPNGAVYRGNINFSNAWSQPANGTSFDSVNPVEAVYIQNPVPGTYTVRVIGENVPGNGQTQIVAQPGDQKIDSNRQGYALIATGNFSAGAQPVLSLASNSVSGGVNGDPFISRNETVTATATITNTSSLLASNVNVQVSVDESSQVPASSIRLNGLGAGQGATLNIGNVAPGATKQQAFQVTLIDDGVERVGQSIILKITMTPAGGIPFTTRLTIIAQMTLVTYRTRFEPMPDAGGTGVIVIPESTWRKRKGNTNAAPDTDKFSGDWQLTTTQHSDQNGSTASLSDPSGAGIGYGISKTSRGDGLVYDDTRWWSPKIAIPGLNIVESTGLASNPEDAARLQAAIDSFAVDVKADFTGDISQNSKEGDFAVMRIRTYDNTVSIKSTDDSGSTPDDFTNLLYLDARTAGSTGFVHYSGNNFVSGTGIFSFIDTSTDTTTDVNKSDAFFRIELQFRRNSFPQSGDGVFFDNVVVRLRVADTAVYASPNAGTVATVNAASYATDVAPGQIVSAFGSGFPAATSISTAATTVPLPTSLSNVSVKVNGLVAPLFYVGVGGAFGPGTFQINYQIPYETAAGTAYVEVLNGEQLAASQYLNISRAAPGVFTLSSTGEGQAAVLNQDYSLNGNTAQVPNSKPEMRGRYVLIYANGQGSLLLDSASLELLSLASGFPAPVSGNPLYITATPPTVTIGGVPATVSFSGLAPGFVGLWQINAQIPINAPTGNNVPLVINFGDKTSRTTTIAIN